MANPHRQKVLTTPKERYMLRRVRYLAGYNRTPPVFVCSCSKCRFTMDRVRLSAGHDILETFLEDAGLPTGTSDAPFVIPSAWLEG